MMNKLTIGIIFCDKDFFLIEDLIKNIEENVHVSYDIILYDNRESDKTELNIKYKIIGQNGKNEFQSKARAEIIKEAESEYIWFVDADDKVCKIPKKFSDLKGSVLCFASYLGDEVVHKRKGKFLINYENTVKYTGGQLWDKWIKTSILKKVAPILEDKEMVCGEDTFIYLYALSKSHFIDYNMETIYKYNLETSSAYGPAYTTFERFERILKKDKLKDMAYKYIDNKWIGETGIWLFLEYEPIYLLHFIQDFNKDDWTKIADSVYNRYTEQEISTSFALFYDDIPWHKEAYEFIKSYFKEKFPVSFSDESIFYIQKKYKKVPRFVTFIKDSII